MSIVVDPLNPRKFPERSNQYPDWLAAQLRGENVAIPESVLEEINPKIEATQIIAPGQVLGPSLNPSSKYVPPPMVVQQLAKIPVTFRVLTAFDNPISGLHLRADGENLVTNEKGEVYIKMYKGHSLDFSIGLEGWHLPKGAKRRIRLNSLIPMTNIFPVSVPTTIELFPQSGQYKINDKLYAQSIIYTSP